MSSNKNLSKPSLSTNDILTRFKTVIVQFIDALIELFPQESDLIVLRVFFDLQAPIVLVADSFITHVLPHKEMIQKRNEKFFLQNDNIFGNIDNGKVLHFKKLWTSSDLEHEDRQIIWKYFDTFIVLVEAYKNSL